MPRRKKQRKRTFIIARISKETPSILKMLKKKARELKMPIVVKISRKQRGRSKVKLDVVRRAMPPGKRISKRGKIYYEYRKNRSDLRGSV